MITTFLRSSSLNSWRGCQSEFFFSYVLGLKSGSNKAAAKGNVLHKAMETMAWKSKLTREGIAEYDDETFGRLKVADIDPVWAIEASYDHYINIEKDVKWNARLDLPECHAWMEKTLTQWGGWFNPMNQIVIEPEVKFDFIIEEPWADYSYDSPWGRIEGRLGIKGTTDLLVQDPNDADVYECVDYKSGRQLDWSTGKPKSYDSLCHDPQLLLYYYALRRRFPDKHIIMTMLFLNYDGPFQMPFGDKHYDEAEALIRRIFDEIRSTEKPAKIAEELRGERCYGFCPYGKRSADSDGKTICQKIRDDIYTIGMDATMAKHGSLKAVKAYGSGGGRQSVDT